MINMIYKCHKGGLYCLVGYATPLHSDYYSQDESIIEIVAVAKNKETLNDINVVSVYNSRAKSTYYAYDSELIDGTMCLYRGLDGEHWLTPREDFHGKVDLEDGGLLRFSRINGEDLFETLSTLLSKIK